MSCGRDREGELAGIGEVRLKHFEDLLFLVVEGFSVPQKINENDGARSRRHVHKISGQ
jgi:hypothetical protein